MESCWSSASPTGGKRVGRRSDIVWTVPTLSGAIILSAPYSYDPGYITPDVGFVATSRVF